MNAVGKPWRPSLSAETRKQLERHFPSPCSRHFDRQGQPLNLADWAEAFEDDEYRAVAKDEVENWLVSTIWTGLSHSLRDSEPPLIFETLVFDNSEEGLKESAKIVERATGRQTDQPLGPEIFTERYATEKEALAGHKRIVQHVRENLTAHR